MKEIKTHPSIFDSMIEYVHGKNTIELKDKYENKLKGAILMLFTLEEIQEAVDTAVGDDGMRSKEVVEILKQHRKHFNNEENHELLQLIKKMEELEQSVININAKYKIKYDEIMLILEQNILNFK